MRVCQQNRGKLSSPLLTSDVLLPHDCGTRFTESRYDTCQSCPLSSIDLGTIMQDIKDRGNCLVCKNHARTGGILKQWQVIESSFYGRQRFLLTRFAGSPAETIFNSCVILLQHVLATKSEFES